MICVAAGLLVSFLRSLFVLFNTACFPTSQRNHISAARWQPVNKNKLIHIHLDMHLLVYYSHYEYTSGAAGSYI